MIGPQTAEEVKLEIGSAYALPEEVEAEIRGRDLVSGLPKTVVLSSEEVREALEVPLSQIIDAVKQTLDKTPPELASDIMDRGIVLAGGGALLQRLTSGSGPRRRCRCMWRSRRSRVWRSARAGRWKSSTRSTAPTRRTPAAGETAAGARSYEGSDFSLTPRVRRAAGGRGQAPFVARPQRLAAGGVRTWTGSGTASRCQTPGGVAH